MIHRLGAGGREGGTEGGRKQNSKNSVAGENARRKEVVFLVVFDSGWRTRKVQTEYLLSCVPDRKPDILSCAGFKRKRKQDSHTRKRKEEERVSLLIDYTKAFLVCEESEPGIFPPNLLRRKLGRFDIRRR